MVLERVQVAGSAVVEVKEGDGWQVVEMERFAAVQEGEAYVHLHEAQGLVGTIPHWKY